MMMAKLAAVMATCPKRHVGAVVVKDRRIVTTGFNGAPPGLPHCTEVGCLVFEDEGTSCRRVLHAEHNAILQDSGKMNGATIYTSYLPCLDCMKAIIGAKIVEIVYEKESGSAKKRYQESRSFAEQAGIHLRKIPAVDIANYLVKHEQAH